MQLFIMYRELFTSYRFDNMSFKISIMAEWYIYYRRLKVVYKEMLTDIIMPHSHI